MLKNGENGHINLNGHFIVVFTLLPIVYSGYIPST